MQPCQFWLALPREILFELLDHRRFASPPRAALVAQRRQSAALLVGVGVGVGVGIGGGVFGFLPCLVLAVDAGYEEAESRD